MLRAVVEHLTLLRGLGDPDLPPVSTWDECLEEMERLRNVIDPVVRTERTLITSLHSNKVILFFHAGRISNTMYFGTLIFNQ